MPAVLREVPPQGYPLDDAHAPESACRARTRRIDDGHPPPSTTRFWQPSVRLLASIKDYQRAQQHDGPLSKVQAKLAVVRHRFWSVVTGADIPLNTRGLGERLDLPHPNGIVIHPEVELGADCRIFQQVTLGTGPKPGVPRVGANVHIGAGAKILGGVQIGDCAVIGANAVVVSDIPAGMTAAGVPTQLKPHARGEWDRDRRTHRDPLDDSSNGTSA